MTNSEWIRSMSDEELATWLHNICAFVSSDNEEPYLSVLDSKGNLLLEEKSTIRFIFQSIRTARSTVNRTAFHTRNLGQTLRMMKQQRFASLKVKAGT